MTQSSSFQEGKKIFGVGSVGPEPGAVQSGKPRVGRRLLRHRGGLPWAGSITVGMTETPLSVWTARSYVVPLEPTAAAGRGPLTLLPFS